MTDYTNLSVTVYLLSNPSLCYWIYSRQNCVGIPIAQSTGQVTLDFQVRIRVTKLPESVGHILFNHLSFSMVS